MGLGKFLKKAAKKSRKHLKHAANKLHEGLKKAGKTLNAGLKQEIESYKALKEGVSKVGGKVIKKLFPHGKDSVAKFLGKTVRVVAKGAELQGKVVATMGDFIIIAGTVTGQPEIVAAGVAMDEAGNAVVVGAQTAEAASKALQYTIQGDQKAAMIALARAVEVGVTGILNTMSMGTFDNFVAAAVDMSEGNFSGAAAQVGQAALDAIESESNVPISTLAPGASIANTSSTEAVDEAVKGQGEGDEERTPMKRKRLDFDQEERPGSDGTVAYSVNEDDLLGEDGDDTFCDRVRRCMGMEGGGEGDGGKKRKITPTTVELNERDHLYNCVQDCLSRSESRRQGLSGKGHAMDSKKHGFCSQSHSVAAMEKPNTASIVDPGLAALGKDQTVPKVQELDKGDKFRSKHNLAVMRSNTQRGFAGNVKVGQRKAVSGVKAVGATKQTVRSISAVPPTQYKDQAYYTIEKMQRTSLKRDDQVIIEKDRKTRVMVLG